MGRVVYDVPLVTQAQNPICWVACMAMVASERLGYSVGVGRYADGFDPSNSSIPNLSRRPGDAIRIMEGYGFTSVGINPNAVEIESLLRTCGPFILTHNCVGFPYGAGRGAVTDPNAAHAVVITGIDSSVNGGTCWFNNPWGDANVPILTSQVIAAVVNRQEPAAYRPIAYYRSQS